MPVDFDKLYNFKGMPLSKIREYRIAASMADRKRMMAFMEYHNIYAQSVKERFGENFKWEDLSMSEKTFHGWMRPILIMSETIINNRWNYWLDIRASHEVEGKPIPRLKFHHPSSDEFKFVSKMIEKCLDYPGKFRYGGKFLYLFIDWLLYSFGSSWVKTLPSEIDDDLNKYWYENFALDMMLIYPADYFVIVASQLYDSKTFNAGAFYPTPSHLVECMVEMTYPDHDDPEMMEKYKYAKVLEPCLGSGIMLLYQSNYSLRLYGQDIDEFMCKIATLNSYLYMPWVVDNDDETNKLLDEMHDKYWNEDEDKKLLETVKEVLNRVTVVDTDNIEPLKLFDFDKLDMEE